MHLQIEKIWPRFPAFSLRSFLPRRLLAHEKRRQTIVEKTPGQYPGHPTTVLLKDGETILCTYPLGHGGPAALTGDRHMPRYAPDGRLVVTFSRLGRRESDARGLGCLGRALRGHHETDCPRSVPGSPDGPPPQVQLRVSGTRAAARRHLRRHDIWPLDRRRIAFRGQRRFPPERDRRQGAIRPLIGDGSNGSRSRPIKRRERLWRDSVGEPVSP